MVIKHPLKVVIFTDSTPHQMISYSNFKYPINTDRQLFSEGFRQNFLLSPSSHLFIDTRHKSSSRNESKVLRTDWIEFVEFDICKLDVVCICVFPFNLSIEIHPNIIITHHTVTAALCSVIMCRDITLRTPLQDLCQVKYKQNISRASQPAHMIRDTSALNTSKISANEEPLMAEIDQ